MTQPSPYVTVSEVAERFRISKEAVRDWARTKKVPAIQLPGGSYRFRREDIDAIERGESPASAA